MEYHAFLERKSQAGEAHGFDPLWMPDFLFDFQKHLVEWAIRRGRGLLSAGCGLGKSIMELVWAENIVRKTEKRVLLLTPLAVGPQMVHEGEKFGVECVQVRDGSLPRGQRIVVSNYEQLHRFSPDDFVGCIADESSILKHFTGATQKAVTRFISKMPYRLLATATAAPNDFIELGTSSEALGELGYTDMLSRFFKYLDDKGQCREASLQIKEERAQKKQHFARLAFRVSQTIGQWRLKHHAVDPFWRWVASWSRACRMPSDLGFEDNGFILPPLDEHNHIIMPSTPPPGMLMTLPAVGLKEEREERRRTMTERCELVAALADHERPVFVSCHMNEEGDRIAALIKGAEQIRGSTPDEERERIFTDFIEGRLRVLVSKPKIAGWGLNLQHCAHVIGFATHSFEGEYQTVRRCWRFGQTRSVRFDRICTEGERGVIENLARKARQADVMFAELIKHINDAQTIKRKNPFTKKQEAPQWL